MSDELFFDTNVLVYAIVSDDPRALIAADLILAGGVISVQVLNEFVAVARRKLKRSWPDIRADLRSFGAVVSDPRAITFSTHTLACIIAERDGFYLYDALIVASALEAGCTTLLTEDMQDGRLIDGRLTIRNPFRA